MKRILITGATGFLGSWVLNHLKAVHPQCEVFATSFEPAPGNILSNHFAQMDLCNSRDIHDYVSECSPTHVVHLAGLIGNAQLSDQLRVNVLGTENLLKALVSLKHSNEIRFIQSSSAAAYGMVRTEELPLTEKQILRPVSDYGVSKLTQDHLAISYYYNYGLQVIIARIFNIVGPAQPDKLVPMTFIKQLKHIKETGDNSLKVGNITSMRDFIDARDVAVAIEALLRNGQAGQVYNVASGQKKSIQELIEILIDLSGLKLTLDISPSRLRKADVPCIYADISKIKTETGWQPEIDIHDSLKHMLEEVAG